MMVATDSSRPTLLFPRATKLHFLNNISTNAQTVSAWAFNSECD